MMNHLLPSLRWVALALLILPGCTQETGEPDTTAAGTTEVAEVTATYPNVTFYVRDHSEGGSVGVESTLGSAGNIPGLNSTKISSGESGQPQHSLTYSFDAEQSTSTVDVYQLTCEVPSGSSFQTHEIEARYEGVALEVWRGDTHVMGLQPSEPE